MGNSRFEGTHSTIIQRGVSEYGNKRDAIKRWLAEGEDTTALFDVQSQYHPNLFFYGFANRLDDSRLQCSKMIRVIREEKSQSRLYLEYNRIIDKIETQRILCEGDMKGLEKIISTLLDEAESIIYHKIQFPVKLQWAESCLECADDLASCHSNNLLKERIRRLKTYLFSV